MHTPTMTLPGDTATSTADGSTRVGISSDGDAAMKVAIVAADAVDVLVREGDAQGKADAVVTTP